jgi:adrenodoxin-NADP+ reductase
VEAGIPYDEKRGIIPNDMGRVDGENGLYCAGWLATGPRGVIVDTMNEAFRVGQVSAVIRLLRPVVNEFS